MEKHIANTKNRSLDDPFQKQVVFLVVILVLTLLCSGGCGKSSDAISQVKKLYRPSPDTDVTSSPDYNFAKFSGTVWKTKVKTAVAELKRYTGAPETTLLAPDAFDPNHPRYYPPKDMKLMIILPVGTRVRIAGLMKDNGAWGAVQVIASVEDGTNTYTTLFLDERLLANNIYLNFRPTTSTNWGVNAEMLEAVKEN